jgi:hypothetical protein
MVVSTDYCTSDASAIIFDGSCNYVRYVSLRLLKGF